eukprot:SAG31_NODE_267_length_18790_cov_3.661655_20_plen_210_part_00
MCAARGWYAVPIKLCGGCECVYTHTTVASGRLAGRRAPPSPRAVPGPAAAGLGIKGLLASVESAACSQGCSVGSLPLGRAHDSPKWSEACPRPRPRLLLPLPPTPPRSPPLLSGPRAPGPPRPRACPATSCASVCPSPCTSIRHGTAALADGLVGVRCSRRAPRRSRHRCRRARRRPSSNPKQSLCMSPRSETSESARLSSLASTSAAW